MSSLLLVLLLLCAVVLLSILLRHLRRTSAGTPDAIKICETTGEVCCGGGDACLHKQSRQHSTAAYSYYDDEELDRFRGRSATDYTSPEIAEWREVLQTLAPSEIQDWVTAVHRRALHIPEALHTEVQQRLSQAVAEA